MADTASNACAGCKQYKRKCNKALPSCSTCSHLRRACNYSIPGPTRAAPEEELTLLRARVEELEKLIDKPTIAKKAWSTSPTPSPVRDFNNQSQPNVSKGLLFLDERYFTHLHCSVERGSVPIPDGIVNVLKGENNQWLAMEQMLSRYFDTIHRWMPIIGKTFAKRVLSRPVDTILADTALLLSCMQLLLYTPQNCASAEDLPLYKAIKEANMQLEVAGLQSLRVIQSGILVAVFEVGHGIYPASYNTVAQCARHAISLGFHIRKAPQFLQPWPEWEEEVRVWWFILMLDRHVTVGRELRPLCTEDPSKHMPLPTDSEAWDGGEMRAPERLYISSPATEIVSPYARLAQEFNLLGRVIRHCDDQDPELGFMLDELNTLHQATSALLEMIRHEDPEDSYEIIAVCFSALFKLHKNFLHNSFHQGLADKADPPQASRIREYTERSFNTMQDISMQTVDLALSLERHIAVWGMDKISPLVLHSLYRGAFWLSYLAATNREKRFISGRPIFDRVLKTLNLRWRAAGTYLDILEVVYKENKADY